MPLDIRALQRRGAQVNVPFFDAEIVVTYDPLTITSPLWRDEIGAKHQELVREYVARTQTALARATPEDLEQLNDERIQQLARERGLNQNLKRERLVKDLNNARVTALKEPEMSWVEQYRPAAFLAAQYVKSWEIEDEGKPLPVAAEAFLDGRLPPQLAQTIVDAIRADANALGKPLISSNGKSATS